ncbi:WAT1-related protein [Rosa sericea]
MMILKREMIEDVALIGGLVGVQFVYAGNSVLLSYFMSLGLDPLTIVIYSSFASFIILSPIAYYFERSKWPNKISLKFVIQLVLIAFGGVTLFQVLFLKGIVLTSPAMATAMPNLAPGLIFVIACTVRLEKVKLSCLYSKVKILGTLLCVVGALTMSIMQSTTSTSTPATEIQYQAHSPDVIFDKQKIIGCLYLLAAVFVLSSNIVLQATTLGDFPAPMSLCAITSFIGVFITAAVQLIQDHKIETGWPLVSARDLIGFSLLGGTVSGACISFNGWAMKKRGPVLVSMFSPIGTVCSVVLSVITLGESISVGSLAGMCLMFTGLYFFLWAKGKEGFPDGDDLESEFDAVKPLLS